MRERCFVKKNSNPPLCGVHSVKLVRDEVYIDDHAPHLGRVIVQRCPISRAVVRDAPVDSN